MWLIQYKDYRYRYIIDYRDKLYIDIISIFKKIKLAPRAQVMPGVS